jgi:hypothetical protein
MVSDEGSIGKSRDLFEVRVEDRFLPTQSLQIIGQVVDKFTLEPLAAQVSIHQNKQVPTHVEAEPKFGIFNSHIQEGIALSLSASYPGYQNGVATVEMSKDLKDGLVLKNILLEPEKASAEQIITASNQNGIARGNRFRDYTNAEINLSTLPSGREESLSIHVVDRSNGESLPATISDRKGNTFPATREGFHLLNTEDAKSGLIIQSKGYISQVGFSMHKTSFDGALKLSMEKLETDQEYALPTLFHSGTTQLLLQPGDPMQALAYTLHNHSDLQVSIYGYGGANQSVELNKRRLETIRMLLIQSGIDATRIRCMEKETLTENPASKDFGRFSFVFSSTEKTSPSDQD